MEKTSKIDTSMPVFKTVFLENIADIVSIKKTNFTDLKIPLILIKIKHFQIENLESIADKIAQLEIRKIGFGIHKESLKSETHSCSYTELNKRNFSNDKLNQFLDYTQDEARSRMPFINLTELENVKKTLHLHARDGRVIILEKNNIEVFTAILYDSIIDEQSTTLISWVWIKSGLPHDMRQLLKLYFTSWLKEQSTEKIFASVHIENKKSIQFFQELGFKPECLFLNL